MGIVPCNGCTLCCKSDAVRLLEGDSPKEYETEPHPTIPGALMIAHKENRDCVYLGDKGCSIHDRRPRMCREMDCRTIFYNMKIPEQGSPWRPIWRRGMFLSYLDYARGHAERYGAAPIL
jgi:Fe-S-cluster containining protein